MQDRYHFWTKMSQADQPSFSAWERAVRIAAGRCSFGNNADEMRPPLPPCLQPFKSSEYISLTWTPQRQPSQKALANNCTKPQPHAKTCSSWHIMSSMVGLQLKNICPSNFKHSGTFEKSSASQTASSLRLLGPSSRLHYGH